MCFVFAGEIRWKVKVNVGAGKDGDWIVTDR